MERESYVQKEGGGKEGVRRDGKLHNSRDIRPAPFTRIN